MTALITSSAEEMNPSRRMTMEDCHVIHPAGTWGCNDADTTYLAICDGHGGRDIFEFLEYALAENVAEELNQKDDASIHTRLERAFLITDVQSHMMNIETSGATVALCLIKKQPKQHRVTIHAANVGDARAVLSCIPCRTSQQSPTSAQLQLQHAQMHTDNDNNNNFNINSNCRRPKEKTAYRLTCDHRADDPIEMTRIEKAGGFVARNRVLGILAVARSLGDHGLKDFVIGRPFVNTVEFDLNSADDQFVIVGCDGLWDVVEDQDAVELVRDFVHKDVNEMAVERRRKEEAAQMLCNLALKRGSSDNVTVVVTWL